LPDEHAAVPGAYEQPGEYVNLADCYDYEPKHRHLVLVATGQHYPDPG
jgi:hypothetical protein